MMFWLRNCCTVDSMAGQKRTGDQLKIDSEEGCVSKQKRSQKLQPLSTQGTGSQEKQSLPSQDKGFHENKSFPNQETGSRGKQSSPSQETGSREKQPLPSPATSTLCREQKHSVDHSSSNLKACPNTAKDAAVVNTALYDVLGVSVRATTEEIRHAYKSLCLSAHPDKGGNEARMARISQAHTVLADPDSRRKYDKFGFKAVQVLEAIEGDDPCAARRAARTEEDDQAFRGKRSSHYNEFEAVKRMRELQAKGLCDSDEDSE
eukprot:gnl/MRDRNA2_/MRDRNA2_158590_c0_seq1.p1 gnl/MRDRNA2_/MRDRNA2_158590_c0~~gnl/MRDRNA2_/MRDRNA2_158590_c0_seq1.p1  ORF type:complete len:262 (-),score=51.22 gnl/MRDRNA2_/MRDRNA2_158590_c0_seq1:107-892(-)